MACILHKCSNPIVLRPLRGTKRHRDVSVFGGLHNCCMLIESGCSTAREPPGNSLRHMAIGCAGDVLTSLWKVHCEDLPKQLHSSVGNCAPRESSSGCSSNGAVWPARRFVDLLAHRVTATLRPACWMRSGWSIRTLCFADVEKILDRFVCLLAQRPH